MSLTSMEKRMRIVEQEAYLQEKSSLKKGAARGRETPK